MKLRLHPEHQEQSSYQTTPSRHKCQVPQDSAQMPLLQEAILDATVWVGLFQASLIPGATATATITLWMGVSVSQNDTVPQPSCPMCLVQPDLIQEERFVERRQPGAPRAKEHPVPVRNKCPSPIWGSHTLWPPVNQECPGRGALSSGST